MAKKLEPLLNRVVLRRIKQATTSTGLLDIAPSGQLSADRAVVVAVGPGMLNVETGEYIDPFLKVGDTVLINPLYGMKARLNNEEVLVQREDEVICREVDE